MRLKMKFVTLVFMLGVSVVNGFGTPSTNCGKSVGCLHSPDGCESAQTCTMTLMYWKSKANDIVTFEARAKGSWVGVGVNTQAAMVGTTGEICKCDGPSCSISGFIANARQRPAQIQNVSGVSAIRISKSNDEISCTFTRTLQPTARYMKDLSSPHYYLIATGPVTAGDIRYHGQRKFVTPSQLKVADFTEDDGIDTNTLLAITLPLGMLIILLVLGFIVFYYSKRRQQGRWAKKNEIYSAGWKYPGRLEPYGYSYRQNPDVHNPRSLDNYSDDVYRKYQPMFTNDGYNADFNTPPRKKVDLNAQPFNKFFREAQNKSGIQHDVYF